MTESYFLENSHRLLWVDTDNRQIISMKSRGFPQTPQDIMEKYNWCSVPQYTRYPLYTRPSSGVPFAFLSDVFSRGYIEMASS